MKRTLYRARWVVPVDRPPIEHGGVVVEDDRIVFVGSSADAAETCVDLDQTVELGEAAVLPGLVNVHTHLELTAFRGLLEDLPFSAWIRELTRLKYRVFTGEDFVDSSLWGCVEALASGVTTVGDTGDSGAPVEAMARSGLTGTFYQEVFGPAMSEAVGAIGAVAKKIRALQEKAPVNVAVGLSPHAVYTVCERLFSFAARYATKDGLDVAVHAAESVAEEQLIRTGEGPFADFLRGRHITVRGREIGVLEYLDGCGLLSIGPLIIHAVQASEADLARLKVTGSRVAHCPRSNAKLGHGVAPLASMRRHGITVGLGSDSVASNNVVDMLGEARAAVLAARAREGDPTLISPREALAMITLDGARALKRDATVGSLTAGKRADLCVVSLSGPHTRPIGDVEAALVFQCTAADVVRTVVAGQEVYVDGAHQRLDVPALWARVEALAQRLKAQRLVH